MRNEFKAVIADPFKTENPNQEANLDNLLTLDNVFELKFYIQCFSESLRMEPPVKQSTSCMLLEDLDIANYHIKKGTPFQIDMKGLQNHPDEWI